jgi:hypothetical protein
MELKDITILLLVCTVIVLMVSVAIADVRVMKLTRKVIEDKSDKAYLSDIIDRKFDEINYLKEKLNSSPGCVCPACGWIPNNYTFRRPYFVPVEPYIIENFTLPDNYTLPHLRTINLTEKDFLVLSGGCNISDPFSPCM